jgi:hypothetical protein
MLPGGASMLTRTLSYARRNRFALLAVGVLAAAGGAAISVSYGGFASAAGGTAKPAGAPVPAGFTTVNPLATPGFTAASGGGAKVHGFDVTGFLQDATVWTGADVAAKCPAEAGNTGRYGGTVKINNVTVTVPCNMVVQMPANTFRWADFVNGGPDLKLGALKAYPSYEMNVVGNVVNGEYIAGLMYFSQQSLNSGTGVITGFDWSNGAIQVDNGSGTTTEVKINDPNGRFGRATASDTSMDPRMSVDDQNPTIHAGTGYPMCVPRSTTADAADPTLPGADDPLCPQSNRPKPVNGQCHIDFGIPLASGVTLSQPPAGQKYCTQFVMPDPATLASGDPDARQQAPFEVGDTITYAGTLVDNGGNPFISAHTIEANVGIYTKPGTQPAYVAIGEFGIGTADPTLTFAPTGVGQETADRIFLESETTDVKTPVDIYMMDTGPTTGVVKNRWLTPEAMTGDVGGGITTQFQGAQPQRARIRATKAPDGVLGAPSRTIRVMQRTLCQPDPNNNYSATLDTCINNAPTYANGLVAGQYFAPVFAYIFPENVKQGDPLVPNDLWQLPFLRYGENSSDAKGVGPLTPNPWGGDPTNDVPPAFLPASTAPPVPHPTPAGGPAAGGGTAGPIVPAAFAGLHFLSPTTAGTPITLQVRLGRSARTVRLIVSDSNGKVVTVVTHGRSNKGKHRITWNGRDRAGNTVPAGAYKVVVVMNALKGGHTTRILVRGIQLT